MKFAISGSSGLIGRQLVTAMRRAGHETRVLVRRAARRHDEIAYDIRAGTIDDAALEGVDGIIHLAGENVGEGRWTADKKRVIRESRVASTRLLAAAVGRMKRAPSAFVCASAIGFYGDRGDTWLDEDSPAGDDFLASVCTDWEQATAPVAAHGVRTVNARLGVVLSPEGGPLAKMMTPFRLGLGGPLGGGDQWMSWVSLGDAVRAIMQVATEDAVRGPVNIVAPQPVTNSELTRELGRALRRPAFMPLPRFAARWAFGEKADALLLSSARVRPKRLMAHGFEFMHPTLRIALDAALERPRAA